MGFSVFTLENAILKVIGNTIDSIDATIMEPLRAQVEKTLIYVTPGEGLDAKLIQCKDMVGVDALTFKVGSLCCLGVGYMGCVYVEERKEKVKHYSFLFYKWYPVTKTKCIKFWPD